MITFQKKKQRTIADIIQDIDDVDFHIFAIDIGLRTARGWKRKKLEKDLIESEEKLDKLFKELRSKLSKKDYEVVLKELRQKGVGVRY